MLGGSLMQISIAHRGSSVASVLSTDHDRT
jgi:hypothetical protein